MPHKKLSSALNAVDWKKNVIDMTSFSGNAEAIAAASLHLAVWSKQLERTDLGNPALCFVREIQSSAHNTAVLISLGLYKPAAASMRAILEGALYYTYFRSHPVELTTLVREQGYYIEKKEIIEFHKTHTLRFHDIERKLGLISRMEKLYGKTSAIIHGQIPGKWISYDSISSITYQERVCTEAIRLFEEVIEVVRRLFLCTVSQDLWHAFSKTAKIHILRGLPGDQKAELGLDSA